MTLGAHEVEDLEAVVAYLREEGGCSTLMIGSCFTGVVSMCPTRAGQSGSLGVLGTRNSAANHTLGMLLEALLPDRPRSTAELQAARAPLGCGATLCSMGAATCTITTCIIGSDEYSRNLRPIAGSTSTIGLWGRSMGAVTALLYSQRDPSVAGMVCVTRACSWFRFMQFPITLQRARLLSCCWVSCVC